jgi:hypothetical protein
MLLLLLPLTRITMHAHVHNFSAAAWPACTTPLCPANSTCLLRAIALLVDIVTSVCASA